MNVNAFEYYIQRFYFYGYTLQLDKAYQDLNYLKKNIPIPKNWETNIETFFFNIYVLKKDYDKALYSIDVILEKEKGEIYVYNNPHSPYNRKLELLKYFNKREEEVSYLKQVCRTNFDWYFNLSKKEDRDWIKESGFVYLLHLINCMKEYNDKELPKYQKIYDQLSYKMNENYETINPNISDVKLKSIISKI